MAAANTLSPTAETDRARVEQPERAVPVTYAQAPPRVIWFDAL